MSFDPNTLAMWVGGSWEGQPRGRIKGFSIDTRTLKKGDMFVALKTDARDGHNFINDAVIKL